MILRRINLATGAVMIEGGATTIRAAEQRVAWCATDNLNMTRSAASAEAVAAGAAFRRGEPYRLNEQYGFELVDEATP